MKVTCYYCNDVRGKTSGRAVEQTCDARSESARYGVRWLAAAFHNGLPSNTAFARCEKQNPAKPGARALALFQRQQFPLEVKVA